MEIKTVLEKEVNRFCMHGTEDWKEGIAAFNEKRKPLYRGEDE
jgi:enoyl-CoA hydratase/carnithine racemase